MLRTGARWSTHQLLSRILLDKESNSVRQYTIACIVDSCFVTSHEPMGKIKASKGVITR